MSAPAPPHHGDEASEEALAALQALHARHDQLLELLRAAHEECIDSLRAAADADLRGRLRRLFPTAAAEAAALSAVLRAGEPGLLAHGLALLASFGGSPGMLRRYARYVHDWADEAERYERRARYLRQDREWEVARWGLRVGGAGRDECAETLERLWEQQQGGGR